MKKILTAALAGTAIALSLAFTAPAFAVLKVGDKAPVFSTQASLAGKEFTYSLAEALKKGPVVLYFYPAAFTQGCSIEARAFAEATDEYKALGATVIGVSNDKIETLNKFSVAECGSKFPVAADTDQKIMKSYDAVMLQKTNYANRASFVIAPSGQVIYVYSDLDPSQHVENTMAAVKKWSATNKLK